MLGRVDCVALLLDHGAAALLADGSGGTALHCTAQHGMVPAIRDPGTRRPGTADANGAAPAMWAVAARAAEAVTALLALSSPVGAVDGSGRTLLHAAAALGGAAGRPQHRGDAARARGQPQLHGVEPALPGPLSPQPGSTPPPTRRRCGRICDGSEEPWR